MDKSERAAKLYGKIAKQYAEEFNSPSDYIDEFLEMVAKNGKILDVGCGPGVDAGHMSSKGFSITGVDLSDEMIRLAKEKFPGIDFKVNDIRMLDFPNESFDGVLASFSLIHIPKKDVPELLKKFHGFLKSSGMLYLSVQEGESEETLITEPLKPDEKMFLNVFSYEEIEGLINQAGFVILKKHKREPLKGEFKFFHLSILARKQKNLEKF